MGHNLNLFLVHYGILALLLVTFVKGVGVPIPIPADLVILAAATASAGGRLVLWQAFGAVLIGMVGGGLIQFGLARGPARNFLYRFGRQIGLTPHRLDLAFKRVENVGVIGVALAVVTPAIRTAAIPACGLTRLPARTFAFGLFVGTFAYIAFQFFVAYGMVKFALAIWTRGDKAWLWLLMVPTFGLAAWVVYRHRTRHLPQFAGPLAEEDRVLRSHRCALCWVTAMADRVGHPDDGVPLSPDRDRPLPSQPLKERNASG